MKNKLKRILILAGAVLVVVLASFVVYIGINQNKTKTSAPVSTNSQTNNTQTNTQTNTPSVPTLADPIAGFKSRITKKPFGIYITPQNSPVQPEKFTGYHTGSDVEYQDVTIDVPVYAIADGMEVAAQSVSGYGGAEILKMNIDGQDRNVLYGHLRLSSLPKMGTKVKKGEQIGLLGTGYSSETSGERRHLHFAVLDSTRIDWRGYVQNKSELSGWIDPVSLY